MHRKREVTKMARKLSGTAEARAYNDERQRQLMAALEGKTAPKKPGAPALTEKDKKYVDEQRKLAKSRKKK